MKNPVTVLIIVTALAILGFGAYLLTQNSSQTNTATIKKVPIASEDNTNSESTRAMIKDDTSMEEEKISDSIINSRYAEYSRPVFDKAAENRRVLFFYASWCPTCRPADADFTQNVNKIPENVTVIRVNYNDPETDQAEKELAGKYGVTYQHTFVQIDGSGKEITKWNGGQTDELLSNIK